MTMTTVVMILVTTISHNAYMRICCISIYIWKFQANGFKSSVGLLFGASLFVTIPKWVSLSWGEPRFRWFKRDIKKQHLLAESSRRDKTMSADPAMNYIRCVLGTCEACPSESWLLGGQVQLKQSMNCYNMFQLGLLTMQSH